ncbi:MAG: hypothetical protein U0V18_09135 [Anaerolineales bacterium]
MENLDKDNDKFDLVILIAILVFTIIIFAWEILSPNSESTQKEEILFKAFEFALPIIIGWYLQKIQSRGEVNKSIKKLAVSAYRRIKDVEKLLYDWQIQ